MGPGGGSDSHINVVAKIDVPTGGSGQSGSITLSGYNEYWLLPDYLFQHDNYQYAFTVTSSKGNVEKRQLSATYSLGSYYVWIISDCGTGSISVDYVLKHDNSGLTVQIFAAK